MFGKFKKRKNQQKQLPSALEKDYQLKITSLDRKREIESFISMDPFCHKDHVLLFEIIETSVGGGLPSYTRTVYSEALHLKKDEEVIKVLKGTTDGYAYGKRFGDSLCHMLRETPLQIILKSEVDKGNLELSLQENRLVYRRRGNGVRPALPEVDIVVLEERTVCVDSEEATVVAAQFTAMAQMRISEHERKNREMEPCFENVEKSEQAFLLKSILDEQMQNAHRYL